MKPTILTLLLLMAMGCTFTAYTPMIVTGVETVSGKTCKYKIQVNDYTTIYSDSAYRVGDTIK